MTNFVEIPLEHNSPGRPRTCCPVPPRFFTEVALVDSGDAARVLARRWTLHKARSGIYVKHIGHGGEFLHRFVLGLPPWRECRLVVDHINHDRLDNRRANLRAVENVLNIANSGANRTAVYSLYKGVSYDRSRHKWIAQITIGGRPKGLGRFETEAEAALAYNAAAVKAWGEHAHLNVVT